MIHTGHGEETIEVVDIQRAVPERELVHGLVVVDAISRADELVRPADVVEHFAVPRGCGERGEVGVDRLKSGSVL